MKSTNEASLTGTVDPPLSQEANIKERDIASLSQASVINQENSVVPEGDNPTSPVMNLGSITHVGCSVSGCTF